MTRIVFLRHGESGANVAGVINDNPARAWPLTQKGRDQARQAGAALAAMGFEAVYVSQFQRTQETARELMAVWPANVRCPMQVDARINERRSGLDGQPVEAFNGLVRPDPVHIRPPGGESFLEQMARVKTFMDAVAQAHPAARILAVSHENPIQAARAVAGVEALRSLAAPVANCAWVSLDWPLAAETFRGYPGLSWESFSP
ncbi:MAG: histidine phosphatase family protein [Pseudomonadota bacterium]